jgi:hypothetical protein
MPDFTKLKNLRARKLDAPSVWLLALPSILGNRAAAIEERKAVVAELPVAWPFRLLWLSEMAASDGPRWLRLSATEDLFSVDGLDNGHWMLFFFEKECAVPDPAWDAQLSRGASENELLRQLSAKALISSLPDDIEWIVASAE